MTSRETHFQMVRPGVALYGGRAVNGRRNPMSRVVTLEAPILEVKEARTGESVGYGASFTLARESRIAVLGIGYADGIFRAMSGTNTHPGGRVAIRGRVLPVIGRVSMDLVTVDVTELGDQFPVPGEMAEIFGPKSRRRRPGGRRRHHRLRAADGAAAGPLPAPLCRRAGARRAVLTGRLPITPGVAVLQLRDEVGDLARSHGDRQTEARLEPPGRRRCAALRLPPKQAAVQKRSKIDVRAHAVLSKLSGCRAGMRPGV